MPYTFEALCAVDLKNSAVKDSSIEKKFTMYTGETMKISCPEKSDTIYQLFTWEIVEDASRAEVSDAISKTCTLKAKREGDVRLKVAYEYGIEEPDILTGIARDVNRPETHEYVIHIKKK